MPKKKSFLGIPDDAKPEELRSLFGTIVVLTLAGMVLFLLMAFGRYI